MLLADATGVHDDGGELGTEAPEGGRMISHEVEKEPLDVDEPIAVQVS